MSRPIHRGGAIPLPFHRLTRGALLATLALGLLLPAAVAGQDEVPTPPFPPVPELDEALAEAGDGLTARYVGVSLANALLGGMATGANLQAEWRGLRAPTFAPTLGLAAGSASMALGVMGIVRGGEERTVGAANLALGAATSWIAWRAGTRPRPAEREIEFHPWIEVDPPSRGAKVAEVRPGVRFEITF
jgi:hypothetical protein